MTLPDRPWEVVRWNSSFPDDLLAAIGYLAIISAEVEQVLHQIYWKHACLTEVSGPIVTDILNPKRLGEDIKKFVRLIPDKANVLDDLTLLLKEHEELNTERNHCLHWIWEADTTGRAAVDLGLAKHPGPFRIKKPIYKQAHAPDTVFDAKKINDLCNNFAWLQTRLHAHAMDESDLRERRSILTQRAFEQHPNLTYADLFFPAPWLDKPLPPETPPSDRRDGRK
jgi:hypothetical protein